MRARRAGLQCVAEQIASDLGLVPAPLASVIAAIEPPTTADTIDTMRSNVIRPGRDVGFRENPGRSIATRAFSMPVLIPPWTTRGPKQPGAAVTCCGPIGVDDTRSCQASRTQLAAGQLAAVTKLNSTTRPVDPLSVAR
jgi:hypothetical protein